MFCRRSRQSLSSGPVAVLLVTAMLLAGCSYFRKEQSKDDFTDQMEKANVACAEGKQSACLDYQSGMQRCTILSKEPACQDVVTGKRKSGSR